MPLLSLGTARLRWERTRTLPGGLHWGTVEAGCLLVQRPFHPGPCSQAVWLLGAVPAEHMTDLQSSEALG